MAYYTREGFKKLRNSLDTLRIDYEKDLKKLGETERDTNLSESTEFIQTRFKITYAYNAKRTNIIENLNTGIIIEDTDEYRVWDGQTISRKCIVTINYDGLTITYKILGDNEADLDNDVLSCSAPIVECMLGKKVGDFIDFNGSTIYIEDIRRIENELIQSQEEVITKGLKPRSK